MHNFANIFLIIKTVYQRIAYSYKVEQRSLREMPLTSLQASLGSISKESRGLGHSWNDTTDSLICK